MTENLKNDGKMTEKNSFRHSIFPTVKPLFDYNDAMTFKFYFR